MGTFQETIHLDGTETIQTIFRSHGFHLLIRIAIPFTALCLLFLFLFPLFRSGMSGVILFFLLLLVGTLAIAHYVMAWYGTIYVLTSRRLLGIRRIGLFKKQAQEIVLENISELSYSTRGFVQMLLRFGDVKLTLYTASHSFLLRDIPNPHEILNAISRQMVAVKKPESTVRDIPTSEENLKKGKMQSLNGGSKTAQ